MCSVRGNVGINTKSFAINSNVTEVYIFFISSKSDRNAELSACQVTSLIFVMTDVCSVITMC